MSSRGYRPRGLPIVLGLIAAAGGLAAADVGRGPEPGCLRRHGGGGGRRRTRPAGGLPAGLAVVAAGIVPIWIAGAVVGSTFGTLAGYPLLILACFSLGRNRRSYRVQAEQSAALLEQYERLRAEQRRADVLDERTRIAREIHDVLAHSLGALGIQIQAAKAMLTDHQDVDRAVEALSTAQRMAADGLTETRRAVHALRVDTLPLAAELDGVVNTHRQRYQVPVTFAPSAPPARCRPTPRSRCSAPRRRRWSTRPSTRPGRTSWSASTTVSATSGSPLPTASKREKPRPPSAGPEHRRRLRADRHAGAPAAAERDTAGGPARRPVGGDRPASACVSGHGRRTGSRILARLPASPDDRPDDRP